MKVFLIYHSVFANTEQMVQAIGNTLKKKLNLSLFI